MGNTYALKIRNKPSNSGGVWVCCPVLRESITLDEDTYMVSFWGP